MLNEPIDNSAIFRHEPYQTEFCEKNPFSPIRSSSHTMEKNVHSLEPRVFDCSQALRKLVQPVSESTFPPLLPGPPRERPNRPFSGSFGGLGPHPQSNEEPAVRIRGVYGPERWDMEALDPELRKTILEHRKLPIWDGSPETFDTHRRLFQTWFGWWSTRLDASDLASSVCRSLPEKERAFFLKLHQDHGWT